MTSGPGTPIAIPEPGPFPVRIRIETPGDEPGVRHVNRAAFPGPEEAAIVDAIREDAPEAGTPSSPSVRPPRPADGIVVGHLLLSPCRVEDEAGESVATVLAIGPVAVLPELQLRGVGAALMAAATSLAVACGVPALVLLGHPAYYPRFGFGSARALGLEPPTPAWPDAAWMARLLPAWTDSMRGIVRYHTAFEPLA